MIFCQKGVCFMKKIGVVTINDYSNYGNRLQNYAVHQLLENMGYYVETIKVKRNITSSRDLSKLKKMSFQEIMFRIKSIYLNKKFSNKIIERNKNIYNFSKKFINESNFVVEDNSLNKSISDSYDCFFVGSDQVWNSNYIFGQNSFYLEGIEPKKKNSICASIGLDHLENSDSKKLIEKIKDFNAISVREKEAKDIIHQFSNQDVTVLLDPTMLIDEEIWNNLISNELYLKKEKNYILIYSLGAIDKKYRKKVKKIATDNNLKIIDLADTKSKYYSVDPIGFISLIKDAKLVFTDSFHGTVFSILMKKPFITTSRITINSLNSRINNLLDIFGLSDRNIKNFDQLDVFYIDYSHVDEILKNERMRAKEFILSACGDRNG